MNRTRVSIAMIATVTATVPLAAQEAPAPGAAEAPAAAPAAPTLGPSLSGPLAGNASPTSFDLGNLGKIYVTGAVSGIGRVQDHSIAGDHSSYGDLSNGQVFIQKVDGIFQFYAQVGIYSIPVLGVPYLRATRNTDATFGPLPQAFIKIAPTSSFSVQAGKLPTLIGAEYTFSVQNMNIDRGLVWNQENAVNKGVQANYTYGPLAFSVSLNDGFYSSKYSWVTGSVTYTINPANVLIFAAGGNTKTTTKNTFSTPGVLNNSEIYNIIYTYTKGPLIVQPYVQYTHVPTLAAFGTTSASTTGGAVLVKYSFTPNFSLPVRAEYISSSGGKTSSAANLIGYGTGSEAWSLTATPTYQYKIFFVRGEVSYVEASNTTPGAVFGSTGNNRSQTRGLVELGVLF